MDDEEEAATSEIHADASGRKGKRKASTALEESSPSQKIRKNPLEDGSIDIDEATLDF